MAGNVTTTNFTYTLDYSGKTNPPAIQVYWPQNGDQVSGAAFTLRGALDDFTASLTAQIVDSSGNTNTVQGLVERNGLFWVENAPLLAGTNYVTLTAMDAVGNISTTNLTINSVSAGLTIDDFSSALGGSRRDIISVVTGTIALTNYTLWVNGVQATQDGQGNWEADSVPLGPGGTAVVEARAIPNSDNNGNGTGTTPPSDGTPGNPTAGDSIAAQVQTDQPTMVYLQSCDSQENSSTTDCNNCDPNCPGTLTDSFESQTCWDVMAGGTATEYYTADLASPCSDYPICWYKYVYTYSPTAPGVCVYTDSFGDDETNSVGPPLLGTEEWSETDHFEWNINSDQCSESGETDYNLHTATTVRLQTGGKGVAGRQNLVEIDVGATAYLSFPVPLPDTFNQDWTTQVVPGNEITVNGKTANANGQIFTVLPDNTTMDITPQAPPQRYSYLVGATKYKSCFEVFVREPWPLYPYYYFGPYGPPAGYPVYGNGVGAGHAWWELLNSAPSAAINQFTSTNCSQWLNQQVGYSPSNAVFISLIPPIKQGPGYLDTNNGDANNQRVYAIGFQGLLGGLNDTENLYNNPGIWNSSTHNCIHEAVKAGNSAGVSLPTGGYTPEFFGLQLPPSDP